MGFLTTTVQFGVGFYTLHMKFQVFLLTDVLKKIHTNSNRNTFEQIVKDERIQKEIGSMLQVVIKRHAELKRFVYCPVFLNQNCLILIYRVSLN